MADDEKRELTKEQFERAVAWLEKKAPGGATCPVCQNNSWKIGPHFVTPLTLEGTSVVLGGALYPQVMTICKVCAHTMYFNAVAMELIESKKQEEEQKEEEPPKSSTDGGNG